MKNLLKNWDYKKHAKVVTGIYLACYAIDMTLGYLIVKSTIDDDGNIKKLKKKDEKIEEVEIELIT